MQTLVRFKSVSPIPVTAALNQRLCSVNVLFYKYLVPKENSNPYYGKYQIDLRPQDTNLLENRFIGGNGFLLGNNVNRWKKSKRNTHTLSPTRAQNSARFPFAAWTSVSPACSAASSSSLVNVSSSFSFSAFSSSYSCSSHDSTQSTGPFLFPNMLAAAFLFLGPDMEGFLVDPSPEGFNTPSDGCARYR